MTITILLLMKPVTDTIETNEALHLRRCYPSQVYRKAIVAIACSYKLAFYSRRNLSIDEIYLLFGIVLKFEGSLVLLCPEYGKSLLSSDISIYLSTKNLIIFVCLIVRFSILDLAWLGCSASTFRVIWNLLELFAKSRSQESWLTVSPSGYWKWTNRINVRQRSDSD